MYTGSKRKELKKITEWKSEGVKRRGSARIRHIDKVVIYIKKFGNRRVDS